MTVSDINLDVLENFLRLDSPTTAEETLLGAVLAAAIEYCRSYTGLTEAELDMYEDIPLAVLALCADMYELRQATTTALQVNPTTLQILSQHSVSLL